MAAPAPKQEELQPHAVRDQLPSVSYCLTSPPPWPEAVLLGFQHYLVMLGTTVIIPTALVPQMGGGNEEKARVVQTLLFVAGINTLIQSFLGTRLPAVMGGSYTFVAPTISIILAGRYSGIADPHEKFVRIMRGTQGALIVASTLQIIIGFSGLWRIVVRLLSPLSAAPLVALVGFGLYELGFPSVAKCVEIGLPQILLLVALSQYVPHLVPLLSTAFERFAVIMSVVLIWLYAFFLTVGGAYKNAAPKTQFHCRTDRSGLVGGAPWISVPYPFQWGAPTFDAGEAFAMMAASFVALVESTGAFIAVSRYASATPCPPSVMSRGIGWQGVGILLGGLFGTANGTTLLFAQEANLTLLHPFILHHGFCDILGFTAHLAHRDVNYFERSGEIAWYCWISSAILDGFYGYPMENTFFTLNATFNTCISNLRVSGCTFIQLFLAILTCSPCNNMEGAAQTTHGYDGNTETYITICKLKAQAHIHP
ncbi:hypothetical protein ACJX0J_010634 [Zea mays]